MLNQMQVSWYSKRGIEYRSVNLNGHQSQCQLTSLSFYRFLLYPLFDLFRSVMLLVMFEIIYSATWLPLRS